MAALRGHPKHSAVGRGRALAGLSGRVGHLQGRQPAPCGPADIRSRWRARHAPAEGRL